MRDQTAENAKLSGMPLEMQQDPQYMKEEELVEQLEQLTQRVN